ncbi:MAG: hypothetical protein J6B50_10310 [Lachnospiraceae bacterium]|nr:hypothetical protein [Lachnospiraceae bacterium]
MRLEVWLSILALLISIGTAVFEYFWNIRINKTNLESELLKDVYKDFLMTKIPEARNFIHYGNDILSDTDKLVDILNEIRHASLFYKYKDKKYYNYLCFKLQALEDKLVMKTGSMSNDDFVIFNADLNKSIEEIYDIIIKKYKGEKIIYKGPKE